MGGLLLLGCEADSDVISLPVESDFPDSDPDSAGGSTNDGDGSSTDENRDPVAPSNTALPTLVGTPRTGAALSVEAGEWLGRVERFSYQWFLDDVAAPNERNASIVVRSELGGRAVRAEVTASNEVGADTVSSEAIVVPMNLDGVGVVPPLFDDDRGELLNPFPTEPDLWGPLGGPIRVDDLDSLEGYNGVRYRGSRFFHRIADVEISLNVNESVITSVVVGEGSSGRVTIVFRDGTLDMFGRESQLSGQMHSPEVVSTTLGAVELLDVSFFDNDLWRYLIRFTPSSATPALRVGVGPFYDDPSETTTEDIRIYGLGIVRE